MPSFRTSSRGSVARRPPLVVVAAATLGAAVFVLPLIGLLARTPWTSLPEVLTNQIVVDALRVSIITSVAAAAISLVLGLPLAWILARTELPGRRLLRAVVTLPMVLPPVVGGATLWFALGRRGLIGEPLYDATGFLFPFSIWGVILANTFVAMPFLVITLEGTLANLDPRHEQAAATLGASRFTVFRVVTLPLISPSIAAGLVLAWARALGEFGATITFAGNLQGRTQTLPLAVYLSLQSDIESAVATSLVLVVVSLIVLLTLRERWWRTR